MSVAAKADVIPPARAVCRWVDVGDAVDPVLVDLQRRRWGWTGWSILNMVVLQLKWKTGNEPDYLG